MCGNTDTSTRNNFDFCPEVILKRVDSDPPWYEGNLLESIPSVQAGVR